MIMLIREAVVVIIMTIQVHSIVTRVESITLMQLMKKRSQLTRVVHFRT